MSSPVKRKRRSSTLSSNTAYDRFWSLVPGRRNFYTELARMQARLDRSLPPTSDSMMRTFSRLIDFISLSRFAIPRSVQECDFCSSLAVQPPFCFAPLPPWFRPVASRQHKNAQAISVAHKCLVQRALNCSTSTHAKLVVMFASKPSASAPSYIRLLKDTDARGQPMLMLPSYRSDLWNFAHIHGIQQLVDTLEQTCLANNVPNAFHPCTVPYGLELLRSDFALLLESVQRYRHEQDVDDEGEEEEEEEEQDDNSLAYSDQVEQQQERRKEQRQERWMAGLIELHERILCADFADWLMYQACQQFHALDDGQDMVRDDASTTASPPALPHSDWLVEAANQLHSDYPPERYHHQGHIFAANRNVDLGQLEHWWREYHRSSDTNLAATKRLRQHQAGDEPQQQESQGCRGTISGRSRDGRLPSSSIPTHADEDSSAALQVDPALDNDDRLSAHWGGFDLDDNSAASSVCNDGEQPHEQDGAELQEHTCPPRPTPMPTIHAGQRNHGSKAVAGLAPAPASAKARTLMGRTRMKQLANMLVVNVCMAGVAFGLGRLSVALTTTATSQPSGTLSVNELVQLALNHLS